MRCRIAILVLFLAISNLLTAQESINSGGGSATGSGGVVTFTTGQSTFTVADGSGGSSSAGVQQAYVITQTGTAPLVYGYPIKVYPNPTAHLLQIDIGHTAEHRYELLDATGKRVQTGKIKNGKATLNMAETAPGNYRLIIFYKKDVQRTFNILKNSM
ncbi:MAG: T9SS type A sorting domain-containing protein [Sphingomonadales bacterium]